jgi:xylulokinase
LHGLTDANASAAHLARAAVEGVLCSLHDALGTLASHGVEPERVLLVGGGARSEAVRALAPTILGVPVHIPPPGEYVADGAARQAAWVLAPNAGPPRWSLPTEQVCRGEFVAEVVARYRAACRLILDRPGLVHMAG